MPFDVERLLSLGRVSAVAPAPDGTWLAVAMARLDDERARYVSDIWRVPTSGSAPEQLTRGKYNDRAPCFRRDGALGFLSKRPDDDDDKEEHDQVWLLPAQGGEAYQLTNEPLGVLQFRFAAEGDLLVVLSEQLQGVPFAEQRPKAKELRTNGPTDLHFPHDSGPIRHWDRWLGRARPHVIVFDERGGDRRDLTPSAHAEYTGDVDLEVSRNGTHIAISERVASDDRLVDWAIRVFGMAQGDSRLIAHGLHLEHAHPLFSHDGRCVYFTRAQRTAERHGKIELCEANIESGETRALFPAWDRWPVPRAALADGRLVVTADDLGTVPIFIVTPNTGEVVRVTRAADGGSHDGVLLAPDGRITGIRHGVFQPPEPFIVDASADATPRLVARLSGFDPKEAEVATASTFDVRAKDGAQVQTWWIQPKGPVRGTLLWIHGGPVGFFGDAWHWRWCALAMAAAGYAIAMPNPRGSTGFGTEFVDGIWNNSWGTTCYDDIMAVADALVATEGDGPRVDPAHFGAMGGSFGGYMVNWIGGHTDRFRALITHASLFHLEAMCGASDYGPYFAIEMGTTPWVDRARFEQNSPHRFVKHWKTPTLILHGEKDYRVPISEALILFDALQEHGVKSELVVFPDENHWILRPRNIAAWYGHVLRFLGAHL